MTTIQVYTAEVELGIADLVAKGSLSIASAIKPSEAKFSQEELAARFKAIASANPNQLDLYYKHSILASIGWNKNDDVFDKLYTWNARNSVSDKQLNLGHNELNIVGHMTNSYVLDAQGEIIKDDTPFEQVPDTFDVISEFVLYKIWADENRLEEIQKVIADIEAGDGYVSMECRFPAFDYALIDKDGNHKTVARNAETAFLSQHLRAFGGTGEYQGYKVGRLLKDFFFTGQGIVTHPANERSIIFDTGSKPFSSKASIILRDTKMDLEQVKAELAAAKAELAKFEAAKAAEIVKAAEEASKAAAKAQADKAAAETALASATASVASKDTAIAALTEELKVANEAVKVAKAETEALKADAKKTARAAKLIEAGVEADKVDATLTKWASLSDEQFADIVAMFPPKKDKGEPDADDKKKKADAAAAEATAQTKVEADLAKAEVEKNALGNSGAGEEVSRGKALANFLAGGLEFSAKASKRLDDKKTK